MTKDDWGEGGVWLIKNNPKMMSFLELIRGCPEMTSLFGGVTLVKIERFCEGIGFVDLPQSQLYFANIC